MNENLEGSRLKYARFMPKFLALQRGPGRPGEGKRTTVPKARQQRFGKKAKIACARQSSERVRKAKPRDPPRCFATHARRSAVFLRCTTSFYRFLGNSRTFVELVELQATANENATERTSMRNTAILAAASVALAFAAATPTLADQSTNKMQSDTNMNAGAGASTGEQGKTSDRTPGKASPDRVEGSTTSGAPGTDASHSPNGTSDRTPAESGGATGK
jgi:hypothetical protein